MRATVTIGPGFIHRAGLGRVLLPHPPVINWLLRRGLTENARYALSFTHEFGHLQSTPMALLYMAAMIAAAFMMHNARPLEITVVLVSAHATWEMTAEVITIAGDNRLYRQSYAGIAISPRVVFWILTGALTIIGWIIVLS